MMMQNMKEGGASGACPHSINIVLSGSRKTGIEDLNLELTKSGKE
jgi:hypothetical protein